MLAGVEFSLGAVEGQSIYACLKLEASRDDSMVVSETLALGRFDHRGDRVSGIRSLY